MDREEQERAQAWFVANWQHGPCPVCRTETWQVYDNLGEIDNLGVGVFPARGRVPVLLVGCGNCGYIIPVNAIHAGIRVPPFRDD